MNEPELNDRSHFALAEDEENFALTRLSVGEEEHKANWIKKSPCSIQWLHTSWKKAQEAGRHSEESAFYLSCLILTIAEGPQRKLLKRKSNPRLTNIELVTEPTAKYLKKALEQINKPYKNKASIMTEKIKTPRIKELESIIDKSLTEIRQKLGFPEVPPLESTYKITPEIVGKINNPKCVNYLNKLDEIDYIFPDILEVICKDLEKDFPNEAEKVISELKETKSRDHLAVFSISTENDQIYISIVNEKGQHVKMEDWNFIRLVENTDVAFRLHEFVYRKSSSYVEPFTFNNNKTGCVVAKMKASNSCLQIACLSMPDERASDNAAFFFDTTYIICLYIALKRLEADKERFNKLFHKSITFKPINDPFVKLSAFF